MACSNGQLFRWQVRIIDSPFEILAVPKVTKVSGVSLGQDGIVEISEYNKTVGLSDGSAKLETLGLVVRYETALDSIVAFKFFQNYWKHRSVKTYTIYVDFTTRNWCPVMSYKFEHCSLASFSLPETFEIGNMKTLEYAMTFLPYDVSVITANQLK